MIRRSLLEANLVTSYFTTAACIVLRGSPPWIDLIAHIEIRPNFRALHLVPTLKCYLVRKGAKNGVSEGITFLISVFLTLNIIYIFAPVVTF